jgi:hypothetical protein
MVDPAKNDPLKTAEGFCNSIQDVLSKLDCDVFSQAGGRADPTAADAVLTTLRSRCDSLQAAVSAGRFVYDGSAAQGCIDALEAVGCKGIFPGMTGGPPFPAACTRVVKGSVAPGATCLDWNTLQGGTGFTLNECAQGSTCRYTDGTVCQSTCAFESNVGESCAGNYSCKADLYCSYDSGDAANYQKCQAYRSNDAACGAYKYCDSNYYFCNTTTSKCQYLPYAGQVSSTVWPYCRPSDSYCPSPCTTGTTVCAPKTYPGGPTACGSVPCQEPTYCNTVSSTCKYYSGEGGSCANGDYCGYPPNGTSVPLYCDQGGHCRRYPATRLGQGDACYNLGSSYCADGLFCDSANVVGRGAYTCQPQLTAGQRCAGGSELCAPGTECRYVGAVADYFCVQQGALGAPCDAMNGGPTCLPGTWCKPPDATTTAGTCALLPGAGQPCASGGMQACAFGTRPDWATTCTCRAFPAEGEGCTGDWECGTTITGRRCVSGTCQPSSCYTPLGWLAGSGGGGT